MKKTIYTIALFAVSFALAPQLQAQAPAQEEQGQKQQRTPEQRATGVSNRLAKDLTLTDDQKKKVYDAALTRAQKMDDARSQAGSDRSQMRTLMKPANDAFEASLKTILTPDQFTKWKADNANQQQNRRPGGQ
jgi:protein CpxP